MDSHTARPALDGQVNPAIARAVAATFAEELQRGLDCADAASYQRSFAADVLWGGPNGDTLAGVAELPPPRPTQPAEKTAPPARFEVVAVRTPAQGVLLAQIRWQPVEPGGVSEMGLYTLVERAGRWWLAAAQHTPIRGPAA